MYGLLKTLRCLLSRRYDIAARNLFLATIKPPSLFWRFMARVILVVTDGVFLAEKFVGYNNLVREPERPRRVQWLASSQRGRCWHTA